MFKLHEIWKRKNENTMVIYYCFQRLDDGMYGVQNAEFFHLPMENNGERGARQALELFLEECPTTRCEWAQSLEEAINLHDASFDNE
jgi:hypothetical protein